MIRIKIGILIYMFKKFLAFIDSLTFNNQSRVLSPYCGTLIPSKLINNVNIAHNVIGISVGVIPNCNEVRAPINGQIIKISRYHNGLTITNDTFSLILKFGLLRDKYPLSAFDLKIKEGDKVKAGDLLLTYNYDELYKIDRNFVCTLTVKQKKSSSTYSFVSIKSVDFQTVLINL